MILMKKCTCGLDKAGVGGNHSDWCDSLTPPNLTDGVMGVDPGNNGHTVVVSYGRVLPTMFIEAMNRLFRQYR